MSDLPSHFWEDEKDRLRVLIRPILEEIATDSIEENMAEMEGLGIDVDWDQANESAADWADQYTDQLLNAIGTTTEDGVGKAISDWFKTPGATSADLNAALAPILKDNIARIDSIGITETTRATTQGDLLAYDAAGIQMPPDWEDPMGASAFFGPPLHPNCRCITAVVLKDGKWLITWKTSNDELVCPDPSLKHPPTYEVPWGSVNGCTELDGICISDGEFLGQQIKGE